MIIKTVTLFLSLILISGCIAKGKVDITIMNNKSKKLGVLNVNIAQVKIENDQLVVDGSNLSGITTVKIVRNGVEQSLAVESSSSSQLIANGITSLTLNVGQVFDMILSTANAAATVPVIFSLNDKSVTGVMLSNMSAQNGEVLTFNGTDWAPASPVDPQLYKGTWDPTVPGSIPNVGTAGNGDYWIISASGTYAGNGVTYAAGDWILEDGDAWVKVPMSANSVSSYNARKGVVVTVPADYVLLKNGSGKLPGSSLNDLANVDLTTTPPVNGNVLKYNGTTWVPGTAGGAAGAIGSTEITDLSITGGDIAENTINPSKIYSSSIDAALYLRGDKTWANFAADVLNVPLSTYALDATTKPTVLVTDRIGPALGKIQKFLNDLDTDYMSKTALTQTVTGTFSFTSPTSFLYTQLPTGASPNEAANVQYVQNYVGTAVSGLSGTAPGTLTTASAATSGDTTLTVASTTGYPAAGTLLVGNEAIIYTGKTAMTFTGLTRGAFGTTAATITGGATVNNYVLMGKSTDTVTPKMVVTGNGNVGIGTSVPNNKLTITNNNVSSVAIDLRSDDSTLANMDYSTARILATQSTNLYTGTRLDLQTATGENSWRTGLSVLNGKVGIGTTAPDATLHVSSNPWSITSGEFNNVYNYYTANGDASSANFWVTKNWGEHDSANNFTGTLGGTLNLVEQQSSGTQNKGIASFNGFSSGSYSASPGSLTLGVGSENFAGNGTSPEGGPNPYGTVSVGALKGTISTVTQNAISPSIVTNAIGVDSKVSNINTGTITTARGLYTTVTNTGGGTITNARGLEIGTISGTNKYSIYQSDVSAPNYFAGNVGIGTSSPTGPFQVDGGTAASGNGNHITITGQAGASSGHTDGGDIILNGGPRFGSGNEGTVRITSNTFISSMFEVASGSGESGYTGVGATSYPYPVSIIGNNGTSEATTIVLRTRNAASDEQYAYVGAAPNNGISTPSIIFGQQTAASAYQERMRIDQNGNVGIGLTNPSYQLQLSTDSAAKPGTSTWTIASDKRLKDIRAPFVRGLEAMEGIHPIYFNYKDGNVLNLPNNKEYVGIIAQDVKKAVPEAVDVDELGFLHVTNDSIIWTMFNGVKELYGKFKNLLARVIDLEKNDSNQNRKIASIDEKVKKLEAENKNKDLEIKLLKERLEKIEKKLK